MIDAITDMAETNKHIMLINADLGFGVVDKFHEKFPDRYINVGIAEQNMTSMAAGLALEGNMVFTYSIGNFPTLRCIEQIRNDICYHDANVKILSVGGGFAYGDLGMTHHATEDIAMMRALPNMRVYVPADAIEAVECLKNATSFSGPAFIRMARGKEPNQHAEDEKLDINKLIAMQADANEISVIASGTVLSEAVKLQQMLHKEKIKVSVYSSPSVKPIDEDGIIALAKSSKLLVTMEDHNIIGGLGGAVAEVISSIPEIHAQLLRVGLQDTYTSEVGNQDYLRDYYGISANRVKPKIMNIMEKYSRCKRF